jgi:hypothetical protein
VINRRDPSRTTAQRHCHICFHLRARAFRSPGSFAPYGAVVLRAWLSTAGFSAVEISTPEMFLVPAAEVGAAMRAAGLVAALFNMPPGGREGDMGLAAQPGREGAAHSSSTVRRQAAVPSANWMPWAALQ